MHICDDICRVLLHIGEIVDICVEYLYDPPVLNTVKRPLGERVEDVPRRNAGAPSVIS